MRKPQKSGVFDAHAKLAKVVAPTPLLPISVNGFRIMCKCESDQPVGAFKLRGAWHRLTDLNDEERRGGVVAFSSGNHAQGVAWAAQRLGISAAIVMPSDAPRLKVEGTQALGAEVIFYDRHSEDRVTIASQLAIERGATLVPSFDDPWIIEGQGSAGLEALAQMDGTPDLVVAPCGGGGLASGLALAIPEAQIAIAEPEGWDDMKQSLRAGKIVPVGSNPPPTSCDALQTPKVSPLTFDILFESNALAVSVSDEEVFAAMRLAHEQLGRRIEPGGAVGLAALMTGRIEPAERTLLMLSGGNVDPELFLQVMAG